MNKGFLSLIHEPNHITHRPKCWFSSNLVLWIHCLPRSIQRVRAVAIGYLCQRYRFPAPKHRSESVRNSEQGRVPVDGLCFSVLRTVDHDELLSRGKAPPTLFWLLDSTRKYKKHRVLSQLATCMVMFWWRKMNCRTNRSKRKRYNGWRKTIDFLQCHFRLGRSIIWIKMVSSRQQRNYLMNWWVLEWKMAVGTISRSKRFR